MTRRATTVRISADFADTAGAVARARGVSVNQVILDALDTEIQRALQDDEFICLLHDLVEWGREILGRLAE